MFPPIGEQGLFTKAGEYIFPLFYPPPSIGMYHLNIPNCLRMYLKARKVHYPYSAKIFSHLGFHRNFWVWPTTELEEPAYAQ